MLVLKLKFDTIANKTINLKPQTTTNQTKGNQKYTTATKPQILSFFRSVRIELRLEKGSFVCVQSKQKIFLKKTHSYNLVT